MFKKLYSLLFIFLFASVFVSNVNAQWDDNFDSYVAGQLLACQNPTQWNTWSNSPCLAGEDMMVTTTHALSLPNAFVTAENEDMVALLGEKNSGVWYVVLISILKTADPDTSICYLTSPITQVVTGHLNASMMLAAAED